MYYTEYDSPLGKMTLAGDEDGLCGLWMEGAKYFGFGVGDTWKRKDALPAFDKARAFLTAYFAGLRPDPAALPLVPYGSAFRQLVFDLLLAIPYGSTLTYGEIARQVTAVTGRPSSARAVGGAVGHNPLSIIIPCHRVMGAKGKLTGYAGGEERKAWLLRHEGAM